MISTFNWLGCKGSQAFLVLGIRRFYGKAEKMSSEKSFLLFLAFGIVIFINFADKSIENIVFIFIKERTNKKQTCNIKNQEGRCAMCAATSLK